MIWDLRWHTWANVDRLCTRKLHWEQSVNIALICCCVKHVTFIKQDLTVSHKLMPHAWSTMKLWKIADEIILRHANVENISAAPWAECARENVPVMRLWQKSCVQKNHVCRPWFRPVPPTSKPASATDGEMSDETASNWGYRWHNMSMTPNNTMLNNYYFHVDQKHHPNLAK